MRIHPTRPVIRLLVASAVLVGTAGGALASLAPAKAQDEPLTIAFSIPGLNFPFFQHTERKVREAAERLGNIEIVTLDG